MNQSEGKNQNTEEHTSGRCWHQTPFLLCLLLLCLSFTVEGSEDGPTGGSVYRKLNSMLNV